jgi:hypothetical protein
VRRSLLNDRSSNQNGYRCDKNNKRSVLYRSLERPYKSGVKKIIGSVDKVGNHCLSAASLVCDRPTHWFLARDLYSLDFLALPFASRQKVAKDINRLFKS